MYESAELALSGTELSPLRVKRDAGKLLGWGVNRGVTFRQKMQGARASNPRQRASTSWYQDGSYTRQKAAGTSKEAFGLHGPCALCNAKLPESSQYGKALDGRSPGRLARLLVLRVPHFTASHANPGGRALRSAGFLSYTRIQAGFGESSPTWCLQIHQVKFPHTVGRLAGWLGLVMSFTPPPLRLVGATPAGSTRLSRCRLT